MLPDNITTERLIIRPFQLSDIQDSYEMNLDPLVSKYTGDGGIVSYDEIERRIKQDVFGDYEKYGFGRMAVELKTSGEFIGFCGLKYLEDLKRIDLGYRLKSVHWGKGYATEAAKAILKSADANPDTQEIIALVLPENKSSINVLHKLNFRYESIYTEDNLTAHLYTRTAHSQPA